MTEYSTIKCWFGGGNIFVKNVALVSATATHAVLARYVSKGEEN
jgi:hypothetical protein